MDEVLESTLIELEYVKNALKKHPEPEKDPATAGKLWVRYYQLTDHGQPRRGKVREPINWIERESLMVTSGGQVRLKLKKNVEPLVFDLVSQ